MSLANGRETSRMPLSGRSSRFGNFSRNMFFAREAAHPRRVRFFPGLNGSLVRSVDDFVLIEPNNSWWNSWRSPEMIDWQSPYEVDANSAHAELLDLATHQSKPLLPIYAVNWTNLQRMNKDTLNTLQYFTGLRNFSLKEQQSPKQLAGVQPVVAKWKRELNSFVTDIFSEQHDSAAKPTQAQPQPQADKPEDVDDQRKQLYSRKTGRLNETRNAKRYGGSTVRYPPIGRSMTTDDLPPLNTRREHTFAAPGSFSKAEEHEYVVLQMLSQILQTDDPGAVGAWLASASDREKALAMELIRSVLNARSQYFSHDDSKAHATAPPTHEAPETGKPRHLSPAQHRRPADGLNTIHEDAEEQPQPQPQPQAHQQQQQPTRHADILNVDEERQFIASVNANMAKPSTAPHPHPPASPRKLPPVAAAHAKQRLPTQATSRSRSSQQSCPHCGNTVETWRPATSYVENGDGNTLQQHTQPRTAPVASAN